MQKPKQSEKIDCLPGIDWNAHAALANAMEVIDIKNPCMVVWIDNDGGVRFRAAATNQERLWMAQVMAGLAVGSIL